MKNDIEWLHGQISELPDKLNLKTPIEFNEETRYLPDSVTSMPGYINFDVNPYMREIVNCFDVRSPIREVAVMKGVQVSYTTCLESILLYYAACISSTPIIFATADRELAKVRLEVNILPMFEQSGLSHIIQSADIGNQRKTGKSKDLLQWQGGGFMTPIGAKNANKFRQTSAQVLFMDEVDAWADTVGKDGDPVALLTDRCSAYWDHRKIFYGSTPLLEDTSKIYKVYRKGDQRKYYVPCKNCNYLQVIEWEDADKNRNFEWEFENGSLIAESVAYKCTACGFKHYNYDKTKMFGSDLSCWKPTATPLNKLIRSYHVPAFLSPVGMQPWAKCVEAFLRGYDTERNRVQDAPSYQVYVNNIEGLPYTLPGNKVDFVSATKLRRFEYKMGEINNSYISKVTGSSILMVICTVDVQKRFLSVATFGITRDFRVFLIEYFRFNAVHENDYCNIAESSCWTALSDFIDNKQYLSDDDIYYKITMTLVDSGYKQDVVANFCSQYSSNVYPIKGVDSIMDKNKIVEFRKFVTQIGVEGYTINTNYYKERLSTALLYDWKDDTLQPRFHFSVPLDTLDNSLKELTVESRRKRENLLTGSYSWYWYRPSGVENELWDLLVYCHAAVEIIAWKICVEQHDLPAVDWDNFWDYLEDSEVFRG